MDDMALQLGGQREWRSTLCKAVRGGGRVGTVCRDGGRDSRVACKGAKAGLK